MYICFRQQTSSFSSSFYFYKPVVPSCHVFLTQSGEEGSSNLSEYYLEDIEGSLLSLAGGSTDKDRFTFMDSENSDAGVLSPFSDPGVVSPLSDPSSHHIRASPNKKKGVFDKSKSETEFEESFLNSDKGNSDKSANLTSDCAETWSADREGLEKLTLYVQGHSDTLLVLLLDPSKQCNKTYINSLVGFLYIIFQKQLLSL